MAKVNGNYTICSNLDFSNNGTPTPAYQFAGNNRNASFTGHVPDKIMETVCTSTDLGGGYAAFNANAEIRIKKARLNADGACGLQCAPGKLAGRFYLGVRQGATGYKPDGVTPSAELAVVELKFKNWGEWVDIDGVLRPYEGNADDWSDYPLGGVHLCRLVFKYLNSNFTCDDYNANSAYLGQDLTPTLELQIDVPGIYSSLDGKIY